MGFTLIFSFGTLKVGYKPYWDTIMEMDKMIADGLTSILQVFHIPEKEILMVLHPIGTVNYCEFPITPTPTNNILQWEISTIVHTS